MASIRHQITLKKYIDFNVIFYAKFNGNESIHLCQSDIDQ